MLLAVEPDPVVRSPLDETPGPDLTLLCSKILQSFFGTLVFGDVGSIDSMHGRAGMGNKIFGFVRPRTILTGSGRSLGSRIPWAGYAG